MKKMFLAILVFAFTGGALQAANLVNKDNEAREVTVTYKQDVKLTFKIPAGFTYKYVCGSCTITMNGSTVEATETDVVVIQGGALSVTE